MIIAFGKLVRTEQGSVTVCMHFLSRHSLGRTEETLENYQTGY